jgi:hypothetical protein
MSQKEIKVGSIKNFTDITGLNEEDVLVRKSLDSVLEIGDDESMTYVATISDLSTDMDGDVVYPLGCDTTRILKNPVVCWNHQHSSPPVGKILGISISEDSIKAKIKVAPTDFGLQLWTLIKGSYLRTNSLGFIIKRAVIRGSKEFAQFVESTGIKVDAACNRIITEFTLFENSLCSVPKDMNTLITAISTKSLVLGEKLTKDLGLKGIETVAIPPVPEAIPIPTVLDAPIVEPKIETKPEQVVVPVIIVPPVVEPKIETPAPVKPIFTVIREGDFIPSKADVKSYSDGKILLI